MKIYIWRDSSGSSLQKVTHITLVTDGFDGAFHWSPPIDGTCIPAEISAPGFCLIKLSAPKYRPKKNLKPQRTPHLVALKKIRREGPRVCVGWSKKISATPMLTTDKIDTYMYDAIYQLDF